MCEAEAEAMVKGSDGFRTTTTTPFELLPPHPPTHTPEPTPTRSGARRVCCMRWCAWYWQS